MVVQRNYTKGDQAIFKDHSEVYRVKILDNSSNHLYYRYRLRIIKVISTEFGNPYAGGPDFTVGMPRKGAKNQWELSDLRNDK